jgi:dTDP-L-rhamnose 4-epimerase
LVKARRLLGYEPSIDFATGIDRFVTWVRQQPLAADTYEQSVREMRAKGLMRG